MTTHALEDRYGRVATDLRVSLTDRCNLRCSYCMPAEGLDWLPDDDVLTDDEVVRLVGIGVRLLGVREVRFTGGEPLVRRGLVDIVRRTQGARPDRRPVADHQRARPGPHRPRPRAAGLDRVNVSLDTIRPETFLEITRRDRLHDVLAGLEAARDAGLGPVKINAVLLRGVNDDQAPELLRWALDHGYELRFIEQMPLDAQHGWSREAMVTADEIFERLEREFVLTPASEPRGSAPAELFLVDGGPATVGVIASVTRPFCGDCDRVRLTADGQVRNCLFAREESDLRAALRAGATDEELADRWVVGDARQARRPRHRRPDVPPARPADVGHRRLSRRGYSVRSDAGTTSFRNSRAPRKSAERGAVLVAGQPDLAAVGGVQLRVVPEQRPDGGRRAALGRADRLRPRSVGHRASRTASLGRSGNGRCRTTTGEAVRHQERTETGETQFARAILSRAPVKSNARAACRAFGFRTVGGSSR